MGTIGDQLDRLFLLEDRDKLTPEEMDALLMMSMVIVGGDPSINMPREILSHRGGDLAHRLKKRWLPSRHAGGAYISNIAAKYVILWAKFISHSGQAAFMRNHHDAHPIYLHSSDLRSALREVLATEYKRYQSAEQSPRKKRDLDIDDLRDFCSLDGQEMNHMYKTGIGLLTLADGRVEASELAERLRAVGTSEPRIHATIEKIKHGLKSYLDVNW